MAQTINDRLPAVSDCAGYKEFAKDLWRCGNALTMCGLCQIRAEDWLAKLARLSDAQLRDFVERYQPGWLNPFVGY